MEIKGDYLIVYLKTAQNPYIYFHFLSYKLIKMYFSKM